MRRIAQVAVIVGAVALISGCKDKNEGVAMAPGQSASTAYQEPSYDYYAPEAQTYSAGNEVYDYPSTTDGSATASVSAGSTHVVVQGDTLYALARTYYQDQARWRDIYEANRGVLTNPDILSVGQRLVIP